jgi:hypothetical protein
VIDSPGYVPPASTYRISSGLRITIAAVIAVVTLLAGLSAYTIAGVALVASRISTADRALDAAIAHRDDLSTTLDTLSGQLQSVTGDNYDPTQARRLMAELVTTSKTAAGTVDGDDAALASARGKLTDHQWLTVFSRARLDHEADRISHARKALNSARILTADYVLVGQFFQAYAEVVIDYVTLIGSFQNKDYTGASMADVSLRTHVDQALSQSGAPGLPNVLHDFLVDFQVLAADLGKLIDTVTGRDQAAFDAALSKVKADNAKLDSYDFSLTGAQIRAYYQPFRDEFDNEMDKATR